MHVYSIIRCPGYDHIHEFHARENHQHSTNLVDIPIGQFLKYNKDGVNFQTQWWYMPEPSTTSSHPPPPPRPPSPVLSLLGTNFPLRGDTLSAQNLAVFKQNIATIIHVMPWDY